MVYTLARYRHARPQVPFRLGGELLRLENRFFLRDAGGVIALSGNLASLSDFPNGSQVTVEVTAVHADHFECRDGTGVTRREREWSPAPRAHAAAYAAFLREIRQFFVGAGFNEVLTPTLVRCPGLEPTLEPFAVSGGAFLPTSPEIHLKKAMAQGWTDIFEIKPCFRREENSPHHAAEFTMLEWYREFADLDFIIDDLSRLLGALEAPKPRVTTFRALFAEILDIPLTPRTTVADLRIHVPAAGRDETFNDLFHRLMIEKIEPALALRGPMIVRDFPPSMAALARLTTEGWADRFELYWRGLEIANAFNEVTDPREQERRWQGEQAERARLGKTALPDDPRMIRALESGLPPSGGIALGLERLYMAIHEVQDIRELRLDFDGP